MKREYIFLALLIVLIKFTPANATHGLIDWMSVRNKPTFDDVAFSGNYHDIVDTPTSLVRFPDTMNYIATWAEMLAENKAMKDTAFAIRNSLWSMENSFLKWSDTGNRIATKYDLLVENKAMRDTAVVLRNLISSSIPVLTNYLQWGDTNTRIATKHNIDQTAQAGRDSASALRSFVYSALTAYPKWGDTSTRLSSIKRLMDTALAIRASIPVLPKADYFNTTTTTSGVATFYLTSNKLSSGTALYTQINYVNPLVNNVNGNYTFGWSLSGDLKTLTVQSRVATNTAVIALLGISLLSSTVQVPNGTEIQVLVKGQ